MGIHTEKHTQTALDKIQEKAAKFVKYRLGQGNEKVRELG